MTFPAQYNPKFLLFDSPLGFGVETVPCLDPQSGKRRGHEITGRRGHAKCELVCVISNLLQAVHDHFKHFWRDAFDWGGAPRGISKVGQSLHDIEQ